MILNELLKQENVLVFVIIELKIGLVFSGKWGSFHIVIQTLHSISLN